MSHHAERISLSVVRGVNLAIRSHLATLSARLAHGPTGASSLHRIKNFTRMSGTDSWRSTVAPSVFFVSFFSPLNATYKFGRGCYQGGVLNRIVAAHV